MKGIVWTEILGSNREPLLSGQQYDPVTQQYYLRARYYNPVITRFTQEDTYRGDGLNLYAYCRNNPVRYMDPSGHWCDDMERVYNGLLKREGFTADMVDPDTQLRLMAEAANQVRGKNITLDHTPELPGPVIGEQLLLPGSVEGGTKIARDGTSRAAQYSSGRENAGLREAINRFAPNVEPEVAPNGKDIYHNPERDISVVYDSLGNYFRIEDTSRPRGRNYLDLSGADMNNEIVNGRVRGRSRPDYQRVTHYNNIDKE